MTKWHVRAFVQGGGRMALPARRGASRRAHGSAEMGATTTSLITRCQDQAQPLAD